MKKSLKFKSINTLLTYSSFTANDAKKVKVSTANLAYYIRKGRIKRLGRGIYQSTKYQYPAKSFQWEDLINDAVKPCPLGQGYKALFALILNIHF